MADCLSGASVGFGSGHLNGPAVPCLPFPIVIPFPLPPVFVLPALPFPPTLPLPKLSFALTCDLSNPIDITAGLSGGRVPCYEVDPDSVDV